MSSTITWGNHYSPHSNFGADGEKQMKKKNTTTTKPYPSNYQIQIEAENPNKIRSFHFSKKKIILCGFYIIYDLHLMWSHRILIPWWRPGH